ncbi:MAG TPA: hypothetical protein VGK58_16865, partial [Lacipirellulaceae bacterium]
VFPPLLAEFSFFAPGLTLFDAFVLYTESAPDEARLLAHFDSITLEALAEMSFEIQDGNGIGLVAASTMGGPHDIALLAGDPDESSELLLYPEVGVNHLFLQRELPEGFETLSDVMLTTAVISELLPGDFNTDGTVDASDYVMWRKNDGSQEGYNIWRTNFGRSVGSAASLTEAPVPEPRGMILFAISLYAMAALRLPRQR